MTIETESSGETAGNQAVRQVSGPSRRPSGTSLGVAGRTEINWCHAEANVVTQNLLVSTLRKEISWCNKARLRGASTSRARAKVWAQLGVQAPGFGGPGLAGPQGLGWGVQGLGPGPTWAWGPSGAWGPGCLRPVFRFW